MGALALLACSCVQKGDASMAGKRASILLSFDAGETVSKTQSSSESNVVMLHAAIYNEEGKLEWERKYDNAFSVAKTISGLEAGEKTVVAVANKEITMPEQLDDFFSIPTVLSDNRRDAFVMVGQAKAKADTSPAEAIVKLERIAAKISFRSSILLNWNCTPPSDFKIAAVYISNAGMRSDLSGSGEAEPELNPRTSTDLTSDALLRDFTCSEFSSWKGSGDIYNKGVDFYLYPNSTQKRTALIIKTNFNGHYSYYPLVIDCPIEKNTLYRCGTITLTCDGMSSPDEDFSSIKISYKYDSLDWTEENLGDAISF